MSSRRVGDLTRGVLVSLGALLFFVLLVEGVLRALEPPPLKSAGNLVRSSTNPEKQFELIPGARGIVAGAEVSINEWGCRDRDYSLSKHGGVVRIVGVGDSLTFGLGVPEEQTFLSRLERQLLAQGLPVEVINCGVYGYNVNEDAARFQELMALLKPDIVIIGYELGDILPNPPPRVEALNERKERVERVPARWERSVVDQLKKSSFITFVAYRFSFLLRKLKLRSWDEPYGDSSPLWKNVRDKYQGMADLAAKGHAKVIVAIIPELSNLNDAYPWREVHARITRLCQEVGFEAVDLLPAFVGQNGPQLWIHPRDRHPNSRGHEIIANGLQDVLAAMVRSRLEESPPSAP